MLAECGAEILISPNGSPFDWPKPDMRMNVAVARVTEPSYRSFISISSAGRYELVFDGAFVRAQCRSLSCRADAGLEESIVLTEWARENGGWVCRTGPRAKLPEGDASAYSACVLGLRDYCWPRTDFLAWCSAFRAASIVRLWPRSPWTRLERNVCRAVMLPYQYTSKESLEDAAACAKALVSRTTWSRLQRRWNGFSEALATLFAGRNEDITEENLQSRARGTVLMAISNKFGLMVLTTATRARCRLDTRRSMAI